MSDDPKGDLMRRSGPLGTGSPVSPEVAAGATRVQSTILYQNDEQTKSINRLEGAVDMGFSGVHARMDKMETRVVDLETFNDRVMLLPKSVKWLTGVVGFNGLIYAAHWLSGSH